MRAALRLGSVVVVGAMLTTGCATSATKDRLDTGLLPTDRDTTNHVNRIIDLWNGSWIAGMIIGVIVWALIIGCAIVYRRRKDDTGVPPQLRYHVPLEVAYTVIPIIMIMVLFGFTAKDQAAIEARFDKPDVKIEVVGKQWAWDFNYTDADVYETSQQIGNEEKKGEWTPRVEEKIPDLYVPVNKKVELTLKARDVDHSFWVPAFLYKKDLIPGHTNYMSFIPQKEGTYSGKCAELCGEFHSEMLFNVKVVSEQEYQRHLDELKAKGQTGQLPADLSRQPGTRTEGDR